MLEKFGYEKDLDFFIGLPTINIDDFDNWMFIHDTYNKCTLDYTNIYKELPTFAVNKRLNYIRYMIDSDILVAFGMGKYRKYVDKVIDRIKSGHIISVSNSANFESYLYGAKKVITTFSQTCREAIFLNKEIEVYSMNSVDDDICEFLENKGFFKWMGNIKELDK